VDAGSREENALKIRANSDFIRKEALRVADRAGFRSASRMTSNQRLPASLTPLDVALRAVLSDLAPVAPIELPLAEALGCVAVGMPQLNASPPCDIAMVDGWALRSRDLVGASSYSPVPFMNSPVWVEAGDAMPKDCDCVVSADSVEENGPLLQVLAEAIPGQGVRRAGGDIAAGSAVEAGRCIGPLELSMARTAALKKLSVRRPRVRIVNVPAVFGNTMELICQTARAAGAEVVLDRAASRDASAIADALDTNGCDLLVSIGGTGVGRTDATVAALAQRGTLIAHGIALQPGRTSALGRLGEIPLIALPGAPDQALAGWWTMALPVLDRLSGRNPRRTLSLPLARKVASQVGMAEIALLQQGEGVWTPLAIGDLPIEIIIRADAWLLISGGSEGFAAGTPADAYMLRE
jgi:molybdopterin molybdotransferase